MHSPIAAETASPGKDVCYVTPRDAVDIRSQMTHLRILPETGFHIEEMHRIDPDALLDLLTLHSKGDLAIVDQFSFYFIDISLVGFRDAVSRLIAAAKTGRIFLLLVDREILPQQHEMLLRAMADGVIRITTVAEGDKIKRYLNIPKMQGARLIEKMLPFTVTDEGFLIDTRERHG